MTMDLLSWDEDARASTPSVPANLSAAAAALDPDAIWDRLEIWTGFRWGVRNFQAVLDGCGGWNAPVGPVAYMTVDRWDGEDWQPATIQTAPVGIQFTRGTWRVLGSVGTLESPRPDAIEAYRRYAETVAETGKHPGFTRWSRDIGGDYTISWSRERNAMAKAMYSSGAAETLRRYRKVRV